MSDTDLLKQVLEEVKREVEAMDSWMKVQEPSPGVSYEDWILKTEQTMRTTHCPSGSERPKIHLQV